MQESTKQDILHAINEIKSQIANQLHTQIAEVKAECNFCTHSISEITQRLAKIETKL